MKRSLVFWKLIWLLIVEDTLTLTDIATGWTECLPLLSRSPEMVEAALVQARTLFPFPILGIDTDNGKGLSTKSSWPIVSGNTSPSPEAIQSARMTSATSNRRMERWFAHLSALVALWENRPLNNSVSCIEHSACMSTAFSRQ
jgi:hypothetical protein